MGWLWVAVTGMAIAPGGILIVKDHLGRAAGDGFVQFTSPDLVDRALEKHKEKIGHRWEELTGARHQGDRSAGWFCGIEGNLGQ